MRCEGCDAAGESGDPGWRYNTVDDCWTCPKCAAELDAEVKQPPAKGCDTCDGDGTQLSSSTCHACTGGDHWHKDQPTPTANACETAKPDAYEPMTDEWLDELQSQLRAYMGDTTKDYIWESLDAHATQALIDAARKGIALPTPTAAPFGHISRANEGQEEPPRRCRLDKMTDAERAITDAMHSVESAGCDVRLTDAINLLSIARDTVADFVDDVSIKHDLTPAAEEMRRKVVEAATKWHEVRETWRKSSPLTCESMEHACGPETFALEEAIRAAKEGK